MVQKDDACGTQPAGTGEGKAQAPSNIVWTQSKVALADRQRNLGQKPATIWLTGLSGAGKSTLAIELEYRLTMAGRSCFVLDGDNVRHGLNRDLGYLPGDRKENIRRIAEVAALFNQAGLIVISAFISPYREDREFARSIIGPERFLETYLSADVETCERRDPKGLYAKARAGLIDNFTGISAPYEVPLVPDIHVNTGTSSVDECIAHIMVRLERSFVAG